METTEQMIERMNARVDALMNKQPHFPFWLLLKTIYHMIRGRRIKRISLHRPYDIEFCD